MNAEVIEKPSTELTVTARAALALSSEQTRKDLKELVAKSANIREVKNAAGRDEAHSAAMALVRAAQEAKAQAAREAAEAADKARRDAEEKRLADERAELDRQRAEFQAEIDRRAAEAKALETPAAEPEKVEAAAPAPLAASDTDPFQQADGSDELDGPQEPSDADIIAWAAASVSQRFGMSFNEALNRLAEVQEWIPVEVAA